MAAKKKDKDEAPKVDKNLPLAERRKQSQALLLGSIVKKYGDGTSTAGSDVRHQNINRIPTGIFILDYALGGGWPRGKINLLWGDRSSTKSTSCLRAIAMAQKMDVLSNKFIFEMEEEEKANAMPMNVHYVDIEGTYDSTWAKKMGVDTEAMTVHRPANAEEGGDIVQATLRSGACDVLVLDSLAAMVPQDEDESSQEDWQQGLQARLNGKMFRKIVGALNMMSKEEGGKLTPTVFVINQQRTKIGVVYGDPRVKPGGSAQDFMASVEVHFSGNKVEYYDGDEKKLPKWAEFDFRVLKNKTSPPKIQGSYKMALVDDPDGDFKATEIVEKSEVLDFCERLGILKKEGNKFYMYGEEFDRKKDLVAQYIEDPLRYALLKRDLINKLCGR